MIVQLAGQSVNVQVQASGFARAQEAVREAIDAQEAAEAAAATAGSAATEAATIAAAAAVAAVVRTDADQNLFIADEAGETNTGIQNLGLGYRALRLAEDDENIAIGVGASGNRTTGSRNNTVGVQSDGAHSGGGSGNNVVGHNSATLNVGDHNTGMGDGVFPLLTTGDENIALGKGGGAALSTGSDNISLGRDAGQSGDGILNKTVAIGRDVQCNREGQAWIGTSVMDELRAGPISLLKLCGVSDLDNVSVYLGGAGNLTDTVGANLGIGPRTMTGSSTGAHNLGIGLAVMEERNNNSGNNLFIGNYAGRYGGTTGSFIDNVGIGKDTFGQATAGIGGVAVGFRSFALCSDTGGNTGLGDSAGYSTTTGYHNVAIGYTTMELNTTGLGNVAVGVKAGFTRTTSDNNTFLGYFSGYLGASGSRNAAVGFESLYNATGNDNAAVGASAGKSITSGVGNTFVGEDSGNNGSQKVDAVGSTALGRDAFTTKDDQFVAGGANVTETLLRGKVGVNKLDPAGQLHVAWQADAATPTFDRAASSAADGAWITTKFKATRTGTMGDAMGVSLQFAIQDDAAVEQTMGYMQVVRRATNNEGEVLIRPRNGAASYAQGLAVRGDQVSLKRQTAPVSGGDATAAFTLTSALIGIYAGTGFPAISAAQGSLYLRADGSTSGDRMYINADGGTSWAAVYTDV